MQTFQIQSKEVNNDLNQLLVYMNNDQFYYE